MGLTEARELFRTDWDENGTVAVYLPREQALNILKRAGWSFLQSRRGNREWQSYIAPDGQLYYELDEALRIALCAEVM